MKENLMEKVLTLNFTENQIRRRTGSDVLIDICPYCGRRWKLNVNLSKQCFRCPACDSSGNAVKLHAALNGIDENTSKSFLNVASISKPIIVNKENKELNVYDIYYRTLVYYRLITFGNLLPKHKQNLIDRGLSENTPYLREYVSCSTLPSVETIFNGVRTLLVDDINKFEIKGIPGFYGKVEYDKITRKENFANLKINLPKDGFLIPIICQEQGHKRLSCFQIRKDYGSHKYIYLTSVGKKNGVSLGECQKIHYTRNFWGQDLSKIKVPEVVNLTEGALKADIAAELSGKPFIAILGVNAYKDLENELEFLKANGCKKINLYFDMDYSTNPNVKNALKKVCNLILSCGLKVTQIKWDKQYKGIDDFLSFKKKGGKTNE